MRKGYWTSDSSCLGVQDFRLAQRLPREIEAVMLVHDPVQNRIRNRGVANPRMPMLNGQLAGNDRGLVGSAVINHLQQIRACLRINASHAPIIEYQYIGFSQRQKPLAKGAAAVTNTQLLTQSWNERSRSTGIAGHDKPE